MKCDESRPTCGPCSKARRVCVYGVPQAGDESSDEERPDVQSSSLVAKQAETQSGLAPEQVSLNHARQAQDDYTNTNGPGLIPAAGRHWPATPHSEHPVNIASPQSTYSASTAYGTEVAPLRWFGLLAGDIDTDVNLQLPSSDDLTRSLQYQQQHDGGHTRLVDSAAGTFGEVIGHQNSSKLLQMPTILSAGPSGDSVGVDERLFWQASEPVRLEEHEYDMFQHFVVSLSQWIDLFDPMKHFSTFVPHLAMRNQARMSVERERDAATALMLETARRCTSTFTALTDIYTIQTGLMKAILALSARHLSIKPLSNGEVNVSRTAAVQYYYETLQYLQSAMRFTTYKNSLELLATTLVVSTYEMIDGAGKGWERHLKAQHTRLSPK
ncbi:hypothetical protein LTR10_005395 [Elasticomyces elasticus]|nr:hypothetical protein LTR10_005395 [Elasticomyces elasticus]KAK4976134.1 hypothetical protein LTR42_003759 [Elasticomyces elasticus]